MTAQTTPEQAAKRLGAVRGAANAAKEAAEAKHAEVGSDLVNRSPAPVVVREPTGAGGHHPRTVTMGCGYTTVRVDLDHPRDDRAQRTLAGKLPGAHAGHLH